MLSILIYLYLLIYLFYQSIYLFQSINPSISTLSICLLSLLPPSLLLHSISVTFHSLIPLISRHHSLKPLSAHSLSFSLSLSLSLLFYVFLIPLSAQSSIQDLMIWTSYMLSIINFLLDLDVCKPCMLYHIRKSIALPFRL